MPKSEKKWSIGTPVPNRLFQTINLYSIAKGISKSQIMRDSLSWWVQRENVDIDSLIKEVSVDCQNEWFRKKSKLDPTENPEKEFKKHITEWETLLAKKTLSIKLIQKILQRVEQ